MNKDRKRRIISTLTTVTVHLLLLLILALVTLKLADSDQIEDGVPVLLGNVEDAAGEDLDGLPNEESAEEQEMPEAEPETSETDATNHPKR